MTGHIRQRAGAWELRYELPRDHTGRRRTRTETIRGGSKRDAQRRLREILSEIDRGMVADAGRMTTAQWLEQWLAECRHTVSPKTWQERAAYVRLHLIPALGAVPLAKLAPVHIQSYLATALNSGRIDGTGGLSAMTACHHERVLHTALARARELRLIPTNPCDDVRRPKVERAPKLTWTTEQQAALLAAAREAGLHAPLLLAIATGLRRGELLGLAWPAIDLEAGTQSPGCTRIR
jgi:integrase